MEGEALVGAIQYPRTDRSPDETLGQETLRKLTAQVLSWRQGTGAFGGLHLHSGTGVSSSLARRYHGETVCGLTVLLESALLLASEPAGSVAYWRHMADSIVGELLWLQLPDGGFAHASGEEEPTYDSYWSCPLHQMIPVIGLLDYRMGLPDGAPVIELLESALKRHMAWFQRFWWKRGNDWRRPLDGPGWCGVANQDIHTIVAMARYGQVTGDWSWYENYGQLVLRSLFDGGAFDWELGVLERGDRANFSERCSDLCKTARALSSLQKMRPDAKMQPVVEAMMRTLSEAIFQDEDGSHHVAWGLDDGRSRKEGSRVWNTSRLQIGDYPALLEFLESSPDAADVPGMREKTEGVRHTLASYVFEDGTLPTVLEEGNELLAVAPSCQALGEFWRFLIRNNPGGLDVEDIPPVSSVMRRCGATTYMANQNCWLIKRGNEPALRGVKSMSHAVLRPGEDLVNYEFRVPVTPDAIEEVGMGVLRNSLT